MSWCYIRFSPLITLARVWPMDWGISGMFRDQREDRDQTRNSDLAADSGSGPGQLRVITESWALSLRLDTKAELSRGEGRGNRKAPVTLVGLGSKKCLVFSSDIALFRPFSCELSSLPWRTTRSISSQGPDTKQLKLTHNQRRVLIRCGCRSEPLRCHGSQQS